MMSKYYMSTRPDTSKYHNQSQVINSRNSTKQGSAYIANKILATKYNENKTHATSLSNAKDSKRMKKLVFLRDQTGK